MVSYSPKPAQFRLPPWAQDFLAEESGTRGITKTQVILEGLESLRRSRQDAELREGYVELHDVMLDEAHEWDSTLMDGLEEEGW